MLIIQNKDDLTLERIYVFDILAHLGNAGTVVRPTFYHPANLFDYYNEIERKLIELGKHNADTFRYLPVDFPKLSITPIISDFFRWSLSFNERGWLVDQTLIKSLSKELEIDSRYIPTNVKTVKKWATKLPHGPRFYLLQDLELEHEQLSSWGLKISGDKFREIMGSSYGKIVLDYMSANLPIFIEIGSQKALDDFINFISGFSPGKEFKSLMIVYFSSDDYAQMLLPHIVRHNWIGISTAHLSLETIFQIVEFLRENDKNWSSRIFFGTGYPLNSSKQISEILSYFLSMDFPGTISDIRKILGANSLGMMPPIYPFLYGIDSDIIFEINPVVYPIVQSELLKIFQNMDSSDLAKIVSIDFVLSPNNDRVIHDSWIITLSLPGRSHISYVSISYRSKRYIVSTSYEHLKDIGRNLKQIREYIIEKLERSHDLISIDLPSHIHKFSDALIKSTKIKKMDKMLYTNFILMREDFEDILMKVSPEIASKIGLGKNDIGIIVSPKKEIWYALRTEYSSERTQKVIQVSSDVLDIFKLNEYEHVDLFKYDGLVRTANGLLFAYFNNPDLLPTDLEDHILLHEEEIISQFKNQFVGNDMIFSLNVSGVPIDLQIKRTKPRLDNGELAIFEFDEFKDITFKPHEYFKDHNIIFVIEDSKVAWSQKQEFSNILFLKSLIQNSELASDELMELLDKFETPALSFHLGTLAAIMSIIDLTHPASQIKLAYTNASDEFDTFTISYGDTSVQYIDLSDSAAESIIKSLISDILNSMNTSSKTNVDHIQMLENLRSVVKTMPAENKTTVVLFLTSMPENLTEFMEQINSILSDEINMFLIDLTSEKLPDIVSESSGIQWAPQIFNFRTFRNKLIDALR